MTRRRRCARLMASAALVVAASPIAAQAPPFHVEEATISGIHAAMADGRLTCRTLVEQYLRRIEAYDKSGPALNAIVVINPQALAEAEDLDRRFKQGGPADRCTASR